MYLTVVKNTILKVRPVDSQYLTADEKVSIKASKDAYKLHSFKVERNHVKVAFQDKSFKEKNTWYAYLGHVEIDTGKDKISLSVPNFKDLSVPFLSQLRNQKEPNRTCNITSLAMCINYYYPEKVKPDDLFNYARVENLSIFEPLSLVQIGKHYGIRSEFNYNGKFESIKNAINNGLPCIVHGYFTGLSGHIIVIKGYNSKGFIVNDPYGEYYKTGYRTDQTGANLTYSYQLIKDLCMPDGDLWLHIVHRL